HEPHDVELLLDRERVQSFTVRPPTNQDFARVDEHLKLRLAVSAGPHNLGVTFVKNPSSLLETLRQPYSAHFNTHRHPRIFPPRPRSFPPPARSTQRAPAPRRAAGGSLPPRRNLPGKKSLPRNRFLPRSCAAPGAGPCRTRTSRGSCRSITRRARSGARSMTE